MCGQRVRRHPGERQIRGTLHETNGFDQAATLVEGQRGIDLDDAEDVLGARDQTNERTSLHLQHQRVVLHADGRGRTADGVAVGACVLWQHRGVHRERWRGLRRQLVERRPDDRDQGFALHVPGHRQGRLQSLASDLATDRRSDQRLLILLDARRQQAVGFGTVLQ